MTTEKFSWWKFITGYLFYLLFHEINRLVPGIIGTILGEGFQSVYAHMKMLFYAYLLVAIIDFILHRKSIKLEPFLYARMFILAAVPWLMIVIYYSFEAVGIFLPGHTELLWGLIMTAVGIYFCIRLETPLDAIPLRGALKALIVFSFAASLITYTGFSFAVPDNFFIAIK